MVLARRKRGWAEGSRGLEGSTRAGNLRRETTAGQKKRESSIRTPVLSYRPLWAQGLYNHNKKCERGVCIVAQ